MKFNATIEKLLYAGAISLSIFLLFFVIFCSWIGYEVKNQCQEAKWEYGGDCVEALTALIDDKGKGFRTRNDAIWALSQLGDSRALPVFKKHYTGIIPAREPLDKMISQYELKKAINLTSGGSNWVAWVWRGILFNDKSSRRKILKETVIVAQPSDPYYRLAQKIAQTEKLEIVEEFSDVLKYNPKYILLVASPQKITKESLLTIGRIFSRSDYYPGLGIISGSTIEKAEQLWERRTEVQSGQNYLGSDVEENQQVFAPAIFNISRGENEEIELNKENLIGVLQKADYLYWARHVGGTTWFWNGESETFGENDELLSKDIPRLKPVVIYTPSCGSFRPWLKESIALGFIDQGAAAYLGNTNSPMTNAFIKRGLAVPGISSWKEFPISMVAQVYNKNTIRTMFTSPQFFMLGDPRIYLSKNQPYQIISDRMDEYGNRFITGESGENGLLAVKIEGGADYDFLQIQGLTSASENDLFYNSKVQTMNFDEDKYVLFLHNGGHFDLRLSKNAPLGWVISDALTDAFDYSWVVLWLDIRMINSAFVYLIPFSFFIIIFLFKILRRKKSMNAYRTVFIISGLLTILRLGYFLTRVNAYTISANFANYSTFQIALGCLGDFACVSAGLMIMKDAKKIVGIILGIWLAVFPSFLQTGFYLPFITFMNTAIEINSMTSKGLWNFNIFWLSFIVLFFEITLVLVMYRTVIVDKKSASERVM